MKITVEKCTYNIEIVCKKEILIGSKCENFNLIKLKKFKLKKLSILIYQVGTSFQLHFSFFLAFPFCFFIPSSLKHFMPVIYFPPTSSTAPTKVFSRKKLISKSRNVTSLHLLFSLILFYFRKIKSAFILIPGRGQNMGGLCTSQKTETCILLLF